MYQSADKPRGAARLVDRPMADLLGPRAAIDRVRKVLGDYLPGMCLNPARLLTALTAPSPEVTEHERLFALGWLHWLSGDFAAALASFDRAIPAFRSLPDLAPLAEAAYWRGRVAALLGQPDAVPAYEAVLRGLPGSPQATTWFVDLLMRCAHIDRAEQVWKSVRVNRRVIGCDEGPLLEARVLVRREEYEAAEHVLTDAAPRSGVVAVERCLLRAWLAASGDAERALAQMSEAEVGPYPPAALKRWREQVERRTRGERLSPPEYLHRAARALLRDDARAALTHACQALADEPEAVSSLLPELHRRTRAEGLAAVFGHAPAGSFVDMGDRLSSWLPATLLLDAATRGDAERAWRVAAELATHPELSAPIAHHLALCLCGVAVVHEAAGRDADADVCWRGGWMAWLCRFAASDPLPADPEIDGRAVLLDHLLADHRDRITALLARDEVRQARQHWELVRQLPANARALHESLAEDLTARWQQFRDDLAGEYLGQTREAMRHGEIPEGWRADYEKGLRSLRRLLSLDRDNVRLLTALLELCHDWFYDLYNLSAGRLLAEQVERFVPFATQLGSLVEAHPGELPARAALAEFYKFRSVCTADLAERRRLCEAALRFNPANDNVRRLLAQLGDSPSEPGT